MIRKICILDLRNETFFFFNLHKDLAEKETKVPGADDVERRRSVLRAQRDKILSMKLQQRQNELEQPENENHTLTTAKLTRPKSGSAARAALAGRLPPNVDERTIQYRRLIMQKIKEEVDGSP